MAMGIGRPVLSLTSTCCCGIFRFPFLFVGALLGGIGPALAETVKQPKHSMSRK
jgi:H+/Cl- antiporter ClcA